jgi:hypothetical protein
MNVGGGESLIILLIAGFVILPIWGIIDAAMTPDDAWARASQSKLVWVVVQIFLGALGTAIYVLAIRPKLRPLS